MKKKVQYPEQEEEEMEVPFGQRKSAGIGGESTGKALVAEWMAIWPMLWNVTDGFNMRNTPYLFKKSFGFRFPNVATLHGMALLG